MPRVTLSSRQGGLLLVLLDGRKQMAGDCRKLAERSVYLKSARSESTFKQWPGARKMCRGGMRVGGEAERKGMEDLSHKELPRAGWKKRRFRSWRDGRRDAGAGVGCSAASWRYPALPGPTLARLHPPGLCVEFPEQTCCSASLIDGSETPSSCRYRVNKYS